MYGKIFDAFPLNASRANGCVDVSSCTLASPCTSTTRQQHKLGTRWRACVNVDLHLGEANNTRLTKLARKKLDMDS